MKKVSGSETDDDSFHTQVNLSSSSVVSVGLYFLPVITLFFSVSFALHVCLPCSCDWCFLTVIAVAFVSAGFALCEMLGEITFDFQQTFLLPIFRQTLHLRSEHTCDRTPRV